MVVTKGTIAITRGGAIVQVININPDLGPFDLSKVLIQIKEYPESLKGLPIYIMSTDFKRGKPYTSNIFVGAITSVNLEGQYTSSYVKSSMDIVQIFREEIDEC